MKKRKGNVAVVTSGRKAEHPKTVARELKRFVVSNGRNKPAVMARDHFSAAVAAVKGGGLKSLGLILEVTQGGGEVRYVSTARVLRAAGMRKAAAIIDAQWEAAIGGATDSGN